MQIPFYKYQGTGNDFIIIDNRDRIFDRTDTKLVARLCDRKFGIGADGLMLLQMQENYDYEMVYYNADGNESTMCGNGGRCLAAFAKNLGLIDKNANFIAIDGPHEAVVISSSGDSHYVSLKMKDVDAVETGDGYLYMNTGSPHYVKIVQDIQNFDVYGEGKSIRYNNRFAREGTNVNFVEQQDGGLFVRTYERGVEDETLSCGTGVTACAISASLKGWVKTEGYCAIKTLGGDLKVKFERDGDSFTDIWLEGPATFVFKGDIDIRN